MRASEAAPSALHALFVLLLLVILCCCLQHARCDEGVLPPHEVDALKQIAAKLKIPTTLWNFGLNPCSGEGNWSVDPQLDGFVTSNLTCTPSTTTNFSNVFTIELKGQNLTGVLPEEFGNLTFLTELDLSLNCISGIIPASAWAKLPLRHLSLLGNRFTGPLPVELGNIATLQSLVLDDNKFQGPLPQSLGKLTSLTRLLLSCNSFTGELPEALGNLKNLSDFRIDGNDISGKIPGFIGNWTNLLRLYMQGTSLEGPFPSIFSRLERIIELRVSNLKKTDGSFPALGRMPNMQYLVLRNCSISGQIPEFIGSTSGLKFLDLSFNNLTGPIPSNFINLRTSVNYIYLTNNMLTGSIPSWMISSTQNMDVSYNNFTVGSEPMPSTCQGNQNFVASYSSAQDNLVAPCLRKDIPCRERANNYEIFINCGGGSVKVGNNEYEADTLPQGPSTFFISNSRKWACSSMGVFVGNSNPKYVVENASILTMPNPELYMTARANPLSLRYYGLCMQKGNYTVSLHFAEIMFTDGPTFSSIGRRFFDVSIQGNKVLRDFNIAEAANGTGKEVIKRFTTLVQGSTLEIHFQWTGKGTNVIPRLGVCGPLVSAISITPNFKPDLGEKKLSIGVIVGIVAASCTLIMLILAFLCFLLRRRDRENNELRGLDLQAAYFSLKQIISATRNFDSANKIGEGGFGPVYKGILPDGTAIAVKQLSAKSKQGNREFVNEIGIISALQHPHLVKLFGCCIEGNQLLLIYEYMENNSLAQALFGPNHVKLNLDWQTRCKICLGIAKGLAYLHEESILKIVHRDIKATNILLDKELNAKISDFGLAKLDEENNTHISTRIAGTMGYMAPEYAMRGYLTDKADVYSFGVVLLEIVSGKSNSNYRPKEEFFFLLDWAYVLQEQHNLLDLVDPRLGADYSNEEAHQMLNLALLCTNPSPTLRPSMSIVVSMLEGRLPIRVPSLGNAYEGSEELRFKSFEKISHDSQNQSTTTTIASSLSMNATKGDATDSYPSTINYFL